MASVCFCFLLLLEVMHIASVHSSLARTRHARAPSSLNCKMCRVGPRLEDEDRHSEALLKPLSSCSHRGGFGSCLDENDSLPLSLFTPPVLIQLTLIDQEAVYPHLPSSGIIRFWYFACIFK